MITPTDNYELICNSFFYSMQNNLRKITYAKKPTISKESQNIYQLYSVIAIIQMKSSKHKSKTGSSLVNN